MGSHRLCRCFSLAHQVLDPTSVNAKILSLNISHPQVIEWQGKSVESSMLKRPVSQLQVEQLSIAGDTFANTKHHGRPDSVLYAYAVDAISDVFSRLGRSAYAHGDLGENLTLDQLNENDVSVGDVFKIGEVIAQATFPRIPCAKINFRVEHPDGQRAMIESGRSGVYFRILRPGLITTSSTVQRIEMAATRFTISEVYERMMGKTKVTAGDLERVSANGAFPMDRISRWFTKDRDFPVPENQQKRSH